MQMSGKGSTFGKMQMVVGRGEKTEKVGEPKGQSNGARDLGRDWDLPQPIVLTLGGSKSSPPILFISQTLGDLWTCKASGLQSRLGGGGRPFHWRRVRL